MRNRNTIGLDDRGRNTIAHMGKSFAPHLIPLNFVDVFPVNVVAFSVNFSNMVLCSGDLNLIWHELSEILFFYK
jgi:hypothetical protein